MENNESKARYVGELAAVIFLEIIMLLFRLVQPIRWPGQVPAVWQGVGNELIFFAIEFILMIIVVGHFIFKESYKSLGLTGFKENIGAFIFNLCIAAVCAGAAFFTSQFSNIIEFDIMQVGMQVILNFIAVAFMSEVLYRGLILNIFLRLTNGKGIITCLGTSFLFALSYLPDLFINLSQVSGSGLFSALMGPFLFGLYLCTLYYYTKNLWMCVIIHGTALTFAAVEPDLIITALAVLYGAGLVVYLISKIVKYYKKDQEEMSTEEEAGDLDENEKVEKSFISHLEEAQIQDEDEVVKTEEISQPEMPTSEDIMDRTKLQHQEKVIEVPNFMVKHLSEENRGVLEEAELERMNDDSLEAASKVESHQDEDDLEKAAINLNTQEELGKVVNLQAKKEQLVRKGRKDINFDDTIIIPCINGEENKGQKKSTFNLKDTNQMVEAEPNFIAHLEEYLGEFEGIYKQVVPTEPPIDIMYFMGDKYHALVTNGMRSMPMSMPPTLNEYGRAELMMFIDPSMNISGQDLYSEENEWLIKLLTDLALYPSHNNSYLGWGHIVGNGEYLEAYDESVDYCGALIYPPLDQKDVNFYRYMEQGESTYIYNVMPLYAEELKFIQEHSGDQFINLMSEMGVKQSIKRHRINIIEELSRR